MNFRLSGKFGWLVVKALVNSEYVSMIRVVAERLFRII
jgi:hypothetical protein